MTNKANFELFRTLKLNRDSELPMYDQLKSFIIEKIEDGSLKEGEMLPPEEILCSHYNVSRPTIRQAFSELVDAGFLVRRRPVGTFVRNHDIVSRYQTPNMVYDRDIYFDENSSAMKVISFKIVHPSGAVQRGLKSETTAVYELKRIAMIDSEPVVCVRTYLPLSYGKEIANEDFSKENVVGILKRVLGLESHRSLRIYKCIAANKGQAASLKVAWNFPLFKIVTICYEKNDQPFMLSEILVRSDCYRVEIESPID
jgi:GntR family transcriptional regulator